jgi:uncharacterized coiled-coil DUF342 family protein
MSKEAPSTWKEWAIQISTESDITKEDVVDLYDKLEKLQAKYDDLKEKFIRLETRIYAVVAVITILIEFILRVMLKV